MVCLWRIILLTWGQAWMWLVSPNKGGLAEWENIQSVRSLTEMVMLRSIVLTKELVKSTLDLSILISTQSSVNPFSPMFRSMESDNTICVMNCVHPLSQTRTWARDCEKPGHVTWPNLNLNTWPWETTSCDLAKPNAQTRDRGKPRDRPPDRLKSNPNRPEIPEPSRTVLKSSE